MRNFPQKNKRTKEDLTEIVVNTSKALNIHVAKSDIRDIYRTPTKSELVTASSVTALRRITASTVTRPTRNPNWPTSLRCQTMRAQSTLPNNLRSIFRFVSVQY